MSFIIIVIMLLLLLIKGGGGGLNFKAKEIEMLISLFIINSNHAFTNLMFLLKSYH